MRIRYDPRDKDKVVVNVGHSIFNTHCKVNVGLLLAKFGGGGHPGAGSCRFPASDSDEYISRILDALVRNEAVEN
jgi:nanoRNase/pAp phosphatase (c-di-AMP/oligoRNAs hydrolase)